MRTSVSKRIGAVAVSMFAATVMAFGPGATAASAFSEWGQDKGIERSVKKDGLKEEKAAKEVKKVAEKLKWEEEWKKWEEEWKKGWEKWEREWFGKDKAGDVAKDGLKDGVKDGELKKV